MPRITNVSSITHDTIAGMSVIDIILLYYFRTALSFSYLEMFSVHRKKIMHMRDRGLKT